MKKADKGREEITDTERKELELLTEDKEFNQRLSKLEKEYQEIKIPDELKGRVIQAMQEARNDAKAEPDASDKKMEEDPRMNRIRRNQKDKKTAVHYLLRTTQTAAAALLVITVLANTNAQTAYAMGKIPVIGAITKVVTFRTYEKQNENSEAKVEVPQGCERFRYFKCGRSGKQIGRRVYKPGYRPVRGRREERRRGSASGSVHGI